jgi:hypothetical protein
MEKALRELGQHQSGHRLIAYIYLYWRGNIVCIRNNQHFEDQTGVFAQVCLELFIWTVSLLTVVKLACHSD